MDVTYFRERVVGPEQTIEDAAASNARCLLFSDQELLWSGGSVPIGAGRPDLILVSYDPDIIALAHGDIGMAQILAYLRAVREARLDTIVDRMRRRPKVVIRHLDDLLEINAITTNSGTYSMSPKWRGILPYVVAIEAKVADWQGAAAQANRNRIFAHRSFVALPERLARRVRKDAIFRRTGIGVLAVDESGDVRIVKNGTRQTPRVWSYYYQLAIVAAKDVGEQANAIQRSDR